MLDVGIQQRATMKYQEDGPKSPQQPVAGAEASLCTVPYSQRTSKDLRALCYRPPTAISNVYPKPYFSCFSSASQI
jgi:hypothetical protein